MSLVQIVLATYNGERFIRQQMDSILNNSFDDFKIEVCDDGSTDQTREIIGEYEKKFPDKVHLHCNKKNLGYTENFLQGIKRTTAPYVMLSDQDDIWMEDKISITLAHMKKTEEKGKPVMVFSDAVLYNSETEEPMGSFQKNSHFDTSKVDISHLLIENKCTGCTLMVNGNIRPYLEEIPEEARVHDWWMALICAAMGKISFLDKETLYYRQHSRNMIGGTGFGSYFANRLRSLREQRVRLRETFRQGKAFYTIFEEQFSPGIKEMCRNFAALPEMGFFRRRYMCIKNGYLKSGLIRNLALLLLL